MTKPEFDEDRWRALWEQYDPARPFVSVRPLEGGISAEVVVIEFIDHDGAHGRVVARRHGPVDFARNPRIAYDERALLLHLREHDYPAPAVVGKGVVPAGIFPNPVLITEFVEGSDTAPLPDHAARAGILLARLHYVPLGRRLRNLPRIEPEPLTYDPATDSDFAGRIVEAAKPAYQLLHPRMGKALLHGDFWPGNLLWHVPPDAPENAWKDSAFAVKVIDWEDAAVGAPYFDFANARLEWRVAYGGDAQEQLSYEYLGRWKAFDIYPLPWFELSAVLRMERKLGEFGLDPGEERRWRAEITEFAEEAIAAIGALRRA